MSKLSGVDKTRGFSSTSVILEFILSQKHGHKHPGINVEARLSHKEFTTPG